MSTIETKTFKTAIALCAKLMPSRGASALPCCQHIVMSGDAGHLRLAATDLDHWIEIMLDTGSGGTPCGPCEIDRPALHAMLQTCAGKGDLRLSLAAQTLTIEAPDGAVTRIATTPYDASVWRARPANPASGWRLIPTALDAAVDWTALACAADPTHDRLRALWISDVLMATDGHRMHVAPIPPDSRVALPTGIECVGVRPVWASVWRTLPTGSREYACHDGYLALHSVSPRCEVLFAARCVDGTRPSIAHVARGAPTDYAIVELTPKTTVKALATFPRDQIIRMTHDRALLLCETTTSDPADDVTTVRINVQARADTLAAERGLNSRYLREACMPRGATADLWLPTDTSAPCYVVYPDGAWAAIMPYRL